VAEPATKTKAAEAVVSADDFAALKEQVAALAAEKAEAEADNNELREIVAEIKRQGQGPRHTAEDAAAVEKAQDVIDFIAGASFPTELPANPSAGMDEKVAKGQRLAAMDKPTRIEVTDAIKVIRADLRRVLAAKRDLEPEEMKTMTVGLRAHIASLFECAEAYYEREDI
jgi:hypothetical protein